MNRIPLADRLHASAPQPQPDSIPLLDVTLYGFMEMLVRQVPRSGLALRYLMGFANLGVDLHVTLAEAIYRAAEVEEEEGNRLVYGILVLPFLKIMEGGEGNE